jgi:hypothetical protein
MQYMGQVSGSTTYFDGNYYNTMQAGTQKGVARTGWPLVTPEEMWNIDTKMDDGRPAYGKVVGDKTTSGGSPNCVNNDIASTANYNFAYKGVACRVTVLPGY